MCVLDVVPYLLDAMSLSGAVPVRAGPMQMLSVAEKDRVVGKERQLKIQRHILLIVVLILIIDVAKKMVAFGLKYERNTTHSSAFKPSVRQQEGSLLFHFSFTRKPLVMNIVQHYSNLSLRLLD